MNTQDERVIEFLAAFDCTPKVAYLLVSCVDLDLRKLYLKYLVNRLETACQQIEKTPNDLRESKHLERLSTLVYHATAAEIDADRRREHLAAALGLLESILAERGDR